MADKIEVKLYPHIGKEKTKVGNQVIETEVDFMQCIVHANGKQVAWYCGRANEPGKHLSFIKPFPEAVQKLIAAEVAKLTGGVGVVTAPPPDEHDDAPTEE
jgi:hypothetical protein